MLTGVCQFVGARERKRIVGNVYYALQSRHLGSVNLCSHHIADEEELCLAVVYDVVYLFGSELVQHRHRYRPVGKSGKKSHSPVGTVSPAKGNFVSFLHSSVLKQDVELFYFPCHIVKLQRSTFVVSECVIVPVVDYTAFNDFVKTRYLFHIKLFV